MQRVHNNAAQVVLEAPRRSHTSPYITLAARSADDWLQSGSAVGSTSTPSYLRLLIQDQQHSRNLRSTTTALCQPSTTTTFVKHPCRCSAPAVWNSLPKTSVNSDSVAVFKRHSSSPGLSLFPLLSSTLAGFSVSEVTTLQRYTDTFIIIIIIIISVKRVQSSFCQVSWCTMVFKVSK